MQEEVTIRAGNPRRQDLGHSDRRAPTINTSDAVRWISLVGGGLLTLYGLRRRQRSLPLALGGGALVYRGATGHFPGSEHLAALAPAASHGDHLGISVEKAVTINKPKEEIYAFWRNVVNLPRVLTYVEYVTPVSDTRSHWVTKVPLGAPLEWDAEITEERENEYIAWRSLPGASVEHVGSVHLSEVPHKRGTEFKVQLAYRPPGGVAGKAVASFFQIVTAQQVQEDLRSLKALMEAGERPTIAGQPSGRKTAEETRHSQTESLDGKAVLGEVIENWGFLAATTASALWFLTRRQKMNFSGKSVVITGGSRGLGLELARCFAREGARLTLLARDEEELDRARRELTRKGAKVLLAPCDVRNQYEVQRAVGQVLEQVGRIDVLVNNAGIIQTGPLDHMSLRDFEDAMAIHFWGPLYLMQAVIPHMRRQGGGRIVNISSIGGKVAVPHLLPYSASKFALVGLSEGMRTELAKDGIKVITVSPGLMRTGSHMNALFKGQHEKEFAWFSTASALPFLSTSAKRAARQIIKACRYGDANLIITPQARFLDLVHTIFPEFTIGMATLIDRLLPRPTDEHGNVLKSGWESQSALAPSPVTSAADQAAVRNNELPEPTASDKEDQSVLIP